MTDLLPLCEQAIKLARRRGAEAAEAFALRERGGSVELEKGTHSSADWWDSSGFGLRVVSGGRVGFAYATSEDQLRAAADQALAASKLGKRIKDFTFPRQKPAPRIGRLHDPRVAGLEAEELLALAQGLLDAVREVREDLLVAGGSVQAGESESALVNSEGAERSHRETGIGTHVYVVQRRDGVSTGFASQESTRLDLDPARVGREGGELAVRSSKPKKLAKGGKLACVVRPESASDLFGTITIPALYGKPAHRGESYYTGKLGRPIMHKTVSIIDDPHLAGGLGSTPFDDEGTTTRAHAAVRRGVLKSFFYDAYDGAEFDHASTASAVRTGGFSGRSYKNPPSATGHQIRIEAPRATTEKLVSSLDRGLLVHDLMGVHTANAVSGDFSVTSSVLFEVRRGDVVGPVAPVSVAGNFHKTLQKGVRLGDDDKPMGGAPAWRLPSVLFEGFTVTP